MNVYYPAQPRLRDFCISTCCHKYSGHYQSGSFAEVLIIQAHLHILHVFLYIKVHHNKCSTKHNKFNYKALMLLLNMTILIRHRLSTGPPAMLLHR
jgi:hypothetical protein